MKRSVLLILLAIAATTVIHAQGIGPSICNSAGGTAIIGTDEFDWSVGEMTMVETFHDSINTNVYLTQGLLQPADYLNDVVHNNTLLANQLQVYPNPASSVVNIQYTSSTQGTLSYKLIDVAGQTVKGGNTAVQPGKTSAQINVSDLADASYMLEITTNAGNTGSESITYKIEKLN